jgi:hypothetical protein
LRQRRTSWVELKKYDKSRIFLIFKVFICMRSKLNNDEKKIKISVTINPELIKILNKNYKNKSKYIENLIYRDLFLNKHINDNFQL